MKSKKIKKIQEAIDTLQSQLDELKQEPKFEVGKWYKYTNNSNFLFCYTGQLNYNYGFNLVGDWSDSMGVASIEDGSEEARPATKEEVEKALIAEAKRRGFKEGDRTERVCLKDGMEWNRGLNPSEITFNFEDRECPYSLFLGAAAIFHNGKWAEIIEEDKVVINGYEMKVDGDIVSFGCARFEAKNLKELWNTVKIFNSQLDFETGAQPNRKIGSIKLNTNKEITIKDLEKIIDKLK